MTEFFEVSRPIRKMLINDLDLVLSWRNHPNIRQYMFTKNEITPEEHRQWFEKSLQDAGRYLLIFQIDECPLGFINFDKSKEGANAEWGFYVSPNAPKGTGQKLGLAALNFGFGELDFHKIYGKVVEFNKKSIQFHLNLNFKQEANLREHFFDGNHYHDVVCFGILRNEWCSN